jgi:hypothetical protein
VIFDVFQDPGNVVFDFGENLKIEINILQKCFFGFFLERVFEFNLNQGHSLNHIERQLDVK